MKKMLMILSMVALLAGGTAVYAGWGGQGNGQGYGKGYGQNNGQGYYGQGYNCPGYNAGANQGYYQRNGKGMRGNQGNRGGNWMAQGRSGFRGRGVGANNGPMAGFIQDAEVNELRNNIRQKQFEMMNLMRQGEIDENQVRSLNNEIAQLRTQMSEKRLDHLLKFRAENPTWQPGAGRFQQNAPAPQAPSTDQ